jgi:nucleoside-diphosphate-sugar epimerase
MILVTGGTGLVGAHLLLHLVKNNDSVRAIHREGSDLRNVEKVFSYYEENSTGLFQKINWVQADINDIPALEIAFADIEYVYHAAAMISFDPGNFEQLMKINVEGTANIVNLSVVNSIKKLCYVSTIGTIGKSLNSNITDEESEWSDDHINVYARSKYAAEMEVWRGSQEGLCVVIVNPGMILGPGFWNTGTGALFKTAHKGYRYYPPGGTGFVSVYDVIRMMTLLMNSTIHNQRFIAVAENLRFQEILSKMCPLLGQSKPSKKLKFWQLEIGRIVDILWNFITGKGRRITRATIYSLKHRDDYSNNKAKEELDFDFEALDPVIIFSCKRFMEENQ